MHHSIRSMTHEDCAAVAALCGQLGYPATTDDIRARFDSITARGAGIVFVAENGGSLVGWIHASVSPVLEADLYGEIAGLVVDASCRSHGVGRTLVKAAEDWARAAGCGAMRVRSRVMRERAHAFYERNGYVRIKTLHAFEKKLAAG
jgi:GNAT superfamily N-acetyltransferase